MKSHALGGNSGFDTSVSFDSYRVAPLLDDTRNFLR